MSYTVDRYRNEIAPVRSFLDYALYVSFFPQLVAGPIERAKHLLPQVCSPRTLTAEGLQTGCYFIFAGLFLKIFVADNIARLIDPVFAGQATESGLRYLLAGYGFAFQIYGDFAGYSYIAKGIGSILGFDIMYNFRLPYFSQNPQEFWRRWHISLSTWLRDYLYIPLGGSRGSTGATVRNLMITMLLGGLWHGAKVTFVLWGGVHGLMLITHRLLNKASPFAVAGATKRHPVIKWLTIVSFFHLIVLTWFIFRAESLDQLWTISSALLFHFNGSDGIGDLARLGYYIAPLLLFQIVQYRADNLLVIFTLPAWVRTSAYVAVFYLIVIFGVNHAQDFIYFQF